jgi:tetratricopeptide (TPR) repeat protein
VAALVALARQLPAEALDEQLRLVAQALECDPRNVDVHDLRATLLAEAGRHGEALAACAPPEFAGAPPCELSGRRAWVLAWSGRRSEAIAEMKATLETHPDYEWGTRMLAEWTAEYGSAAEAASAAERYVRVAPGSAAPYVSRGAARLRGGDPDGGRADLEHALALDPGHVEAGARLFDALLDARRFDDAGALLKHLQPHMTPEQRVCRDVRLLAARGNGPQALDALSDELGAGRAPGPALAAALNAVHDALSGQGLATAASRAAATLHPEAAGLVVDVLVQKGSSADAGGLLDALASRPEAATEACRAWLNASSDQPADRTAAERLRQLAPADPEALALAARAHAQDPPAERLRLYAEVLRLDPAHLEARDLRALLLTQIESWDEARMACRKLPGEKEVPAALRARAAWIEATRGKVAEARRMMRAVVKDHPLHRWAWDRLLEWGFRDKEAKALYLEDAKAHCAVFPGEPPAHGYLGDAFRRTGRPAEAEAAFRRSLELDPEYEWGRLALVDMLLEAGRAKDAEAALDVPDATPPLLERRIEAALAQRKPALARETFVALLAAPSADDDLRRRARELFVSAKAKPELRRAFDDALAGKGAPDAAASLYVEWLGAEKDWRACDAVLQKLARGRPSLRTAALAGYVRSLRAAEDRSRLVRLVKSQRAALRADDFLWSLAGHALSLVDDREAASWMQDWARRKTSPWALNGLAISLRHLHRAEEAVRVSRRALSLEPDHITPCHRAWIGIEEALAGDVDEAESLMGDLEPPEESKAFYDALALLARAAIAVRRSRAAGFDEARRLIQQADSLSGRNNRDSLPLRTRTVQLVVRETGTLRAWLWRFFSAG